MILIIGYGNPLRGDDAVGPVAAAALAGLYEKDTAVDVLTVQQLAPELAEKVARYDLAVLVDARLQAPAGQVILEDVVLSSRKSSRPFSHHMTPHELLAITQELYRVSPRMVMASITTESFEVGSPLTAEVETALAPLIERIKSLVHDHRQPGDRGPEI